jgi:hypothetical protein
MPIHIYRAYPANVSDRDTYGVISNCTESTTLLKTSADVSTFLIYERWDP